MLRPAQLAGPVVRFETMMGQQLQVDWVDFRKGDKALHAFCATLGYSRVSYAEFVDNIKVESLIEMLDNIVHGALARTFIANASVPCASGTNCPFIAQAYSAAAQQAALVGIELDRG